MKLKAVLTAALAGLMALTLCACGEGQESSKEAQSSAESEQVQSEASAQENSADASTTDDDAPAGEPVDAEWFNDAVFVGDSVTLKLSYYAEDGALGKADFLCAGSLGYNNALMDIDEEGNVHPTYQGEKYTVDEGISKIGKKKVFIMLGMNDIGLYGVDGAIDGMKKLTERILDKTPDATLYFQSVTPMVEGNTLGSLTNESIAEFDKQLRAVCKEKGYKYLNVASAVSDGNGNLIYDYCGDPPTEDNPDAMGLHFTDTGCQKWVDYLCTHVE